MLSILCINRFVSAQVKVVANEFYCSDNDKSWLNYPNSNFAVDFTCKSTERLIRRLLYQLGERNKFKTSLFHQWNGLPEAGERAGTGTVHM